MVICINLKTSIGTRLDKGLPMCEVWRLKCCKFSDSHCTLRNGGPEKGIIIIRIVPKTKINE